MDKRLFKDIIVIFLLIILSTVSLYSEEEAKDKVCILLQVSLSESSKWDLFRYVITDAMRVELNLVDFIVIPVSEWQEIKKREQFSDTDLLSGANAVSLGRMLEVDQVITGFVRVDQGRILFSLKSYDTATGRLTGAVVKSGRAGLHVYNLINEAAAELIPALQAEISPLPQEVVIIQEEKLVKDITFEEEISEMGRLIRVTLLARGEDEGAEILLAGDRLAGVITNGKLSFTAKADTRLVIVNRKEGYHPDRQVFKLGDRDKRIKLRPLIPVARRGLELEYTSMQMLGLGGAYRYYIKPDQFLVRVADYLYLQYPFLNPNARPVIHNDFMLQVGHYVLFPPSSRFRVMVNTGLGAIITLFTDFSLYSNMDNPIFTDFYLNILGFWMEANFSHWSYFYRMDMRYALGWGNNLIGAGGFSNGGPVLTIGAVKKW
ncbi:MAG: hypothetical protein GH155_08070 [Spirochaeta sp.]|nr:hypothetical protein [Spirochaeta sp.]